MENFLKCSKILSRRLSKNFSFALNSLNNDSSCWKQPYFYLKKKGLSEKTTKFESFPMTLFDLNQTREIVLTENCSNRSFSATATLDISNKSLRKPLKL